MKSFLIVIWGIMSSLCVTARSFELLEDVDSLRIVGLKYSLGMDVSMPKASFFEKIQEYKQIYKRLENEDIVIRGPYAYVDTMITSSEEVSAFLVELSMLKREKKKKYDNDCIMMNASYNRRENKIIWSDISPNDYELLIILFSSNQERFIWFDDTKRVEKKRHQYYISKGLAYLLSHYTNVYNYMVVPN